MLPYLSRKVPRVLPHSRADKGWDTLVPYDTLEGNGRMALIICDHGEAA